MLHLLKDFFLKVILGVSLLSVSPQQQELLEQKIEQNSELVCEEDKSRCYCDYDKDKTDLAIIVKKGGIYDHRGLENKLKTLGDSITKDVSIGNTSVVLFTGTSTSELDQFVADLYSNEDVGYVILIGDDLVPKDQLQSLTHNIKLKLSLVGKESHLPPDYKKLNPDGYCSDVAISWILPPLGYTPERKVEFVQGVIEQYTKYHLGEIPQYEPGYLHIQWENGHPTMGSDLNARLESAYGLEKTQVYNYEFDRVREEFPKYALLYYNVHGSQTIVGLGLELDPNPSGTEQSRVYTTLREFSEVSEQMGHPLLVESSTCQSTALSYSTELLTFEDCCWPQMMIGSGIWAKYSFGGSGNQINSMQYEITHSRFIGEAIRKMPITQFYIFGDITAHLPE